METPQLVAVLLMAIVGLTLIAGILLWALRRPRIRVLLFNPTAGIVRLLWFKPASEVDVPLTNGKTARVVLDRSKALQGKKGLWYCYNEGTGQCFMPDATGTISYGSVNYHEASVLRLKNELHSFKKGDNQMWKWIFLGLCVLAVAGIIALIVQKVGGS